MVRRALAYEILSAFGIVHRRRDGVASHLCSFGAIGRPGVRLLSPAAALAISATCGKLRLSFSI